MSRLTESGPILTEVGLERRFSRTGTFIPAAGVPVNLVRAVGMSCRTRGRDARSGVDIRIMALLR